MLFDRNINYKVIIIWDTALVLNETLQLDTAGWNKNQYAL